MVRYTDNYRCNVIHEIHVRGRVIWDPQEPQFRSVGARNYAFDGVPERLGLVQTVRDAVYGNSAIQDIRRMWRQWVRAYYAYKQRRTRKPKFAPELSFLDELSMDSLNAIASMY